LFFRYDLVNFPQAGLNLWSSCLHFPTNWNYRSIPPYQVLPDFDIELITFFLVLRAIILQFDICNNLIRFNSFSAKLKCVVDFNKRFPSVSSTSSLKTLLPQYLPNLMSLTSVSPSPCQV
jgi:hypothetical protein